MAHNKHDAATYSAEHETMSLAQIESALTEMWRAAYEAGGPPIIRTAVANLIVYVGDETAADTLRESLGRLAARHPTRAILLSDSEDSGATGPNAWVSMHCHIAPGGRQQLCGEEISLRVQREQVEDLATIVLPLLLPDLPVVLYWRAAPDLQSPLFQRLAELADRIILDSALAPQPTQYFSMLSAETEGREPLPIGDLTWSRLAGWRELTAQLFDPADLRKYLDSIQSIELYHRGTSEGHLAEPYLYLSWLASRLGWEMDDWNESVRELRLRRREEAIEVRFRGDDDPAAPRGALQEVTLRAGSLARFEVQQHEGRTCGTIRATVGAREVLDETMLFVEPDEMEALSQQLDLITVDPIFISAVRWAAHISRGVQ